MDILSLIVGVIIGLVAAIILPVRERVLAVRRALQERAVATRRYVTRSADARYRLDLERDCQTLHLAGHLTPLSAIIVEPRFLPVPALPDPTLEDERGSVLDVVPQHLDLPFGDAPFNLETLSLVDLASGGRRLAILGLPGAGKTTALAAIALHALGELRFETLSEMVDAVDTAMHEGMSEEEIEKLRRRQQEIEERAMARLRELQLTEDVDGAAVAPVARVDWRVFTPMLIHLAEIELNPAVIGPEVDPAEPLVRAIQGRVGPVTQRTIPRFVYRRVASGQALLLIDGYDDLPPDLRAEKLAWLRHFVEVYPDNLIYIVGPAEGYGPLVNLGFSPVFLRPWTEQDARTLAEKWAAAWPTIARRGRRLAAPPDERALRQATTNVRARTPLDLTLKVWAAYAGDAREAGRLGWYDAYVQRQLGPDLPEPARGALEMAAARILDGDGFGIARSELSALFTKAVTGPEEGAKLAVNVDGFLRDLTGKHRLMKVYPGDVMVFNHPVLCRYLAAEHAAGNETRAVADLLNVPAWRDAFPFLAARTDIERAVAALLASQTDLLSSSLFEIARWLPDANPSARWRGEVFKRLARVLTAPAQFPSVRERAMAALVSSRDENTLFIFRQALQAQDAGVRRLACLGIGALGVTDGIKDLTPMLSDGDRDVRLAAALALGAIGSERAMEIMVRGLLEGEEDLKRAVAEALAAIPGEGHGVIRDAVDDEDMQIRRAAVFGLRRIKAAWALVALYRLMLEDSQWYVRSAAEEAFAQARDPQAAGLKRYPPAEEILWLVNWAAGRGEGVPQGEAAYQVLLRALQLGEPDFRRAAAETLGRLGYVPALKPLYAALRDQEPTVRDGVFRALESFQVQLGAALPGVY